MGLVEARVVRRSIRVKMYSENHLTYANYQSPDLNILRP